MQDVTDSVRKARLEVKALVDEIDIRQVAGPAEAAA
jgi:hypothetical protein